MMYRVNSKNFSPSTRPVSHHGRLTSTPPLRALTPALGVLFLTACASLPKADYFARCQGRQQSETKSIPLTTSPTGLNPDIFANVKNGDLIFAGADSAIDLAFRLCSKDFDFYGHGGIIAIERSEHVVYESLAKLKILAPSSTVNERFRGGVTRTPLLEFIHRYKRIKIIRAAETGLGEKTAAQAKVFFNRGIPFDPYFDRGDSSKVYCTEFLELLLKTVESPSLPSPAPRTTSPSADAFYKSLGIEAPFFTTSGSFERMTGASVVTEIDCYPEAHDCANTKHIFHFINQKISQGQFPINTFLVFDSKQVFSFSDRCACFIEICFGVLGRNPTISQTEREVILTSVFDSVFSTKDRSR